MSKRTVAVVGGGPAGLFAARLLRTRHADWEVSLFERLPPDDTFGFGVGLTGAALSRVGSVDPVLCEELIASSLENTTAEFRIRGRSLTMSHFHSGGSIGRARLLRILLENAQNAGVEVHIGSSVDVMQLAEEADLVIAADGASSPTRGQHAPAYQADVTLGRSLYMWCGADVQLKGTVFMAMETEHGVFMTHAYPFAPNRSTFVMEADEATWRAAGLDSWQPTDPASDESDQASLELLSVVFSELLEGQPLLGNRSRWARFRTVTCGRWYRGNVVLLGDSAATVHYSLGSGTKLALESAASLADALDDDALPLATQLAAYETAWRPSVERLQARSRLSQIWWDSLPTRLDLTPARMCASYYTRAGAVSLEDNLTDSLGFSQAAIAEWSQVNNEDIPTSDLARWLASRPLDSEHVRSPSRNLNEATVAAKADGLALSLHVVPTRLGDASGPASDEVLSQAIEAVKAGAHVIVLQGPTDRSSLLERLALAERIRLETKAVVAVDALDRDANDIGDALVSGRLDLVRWLDGPGATTDRTDAA